MPRPGASLRVATYNVHACIGTDRRHDPVWAPGKSPASTRI